MLPQSTHYALVTCLISICSAIRVHFNTNTGPIVPPTPRTTIRPMPPYQEPAPVWENQSNDIPNPNSYVYILPPPSRPRDTDFGSPWQRPAHYYGNLLLPTDLKTQGNANAGLGGSLAAKYIPNVGIRYTAVVPQNTNNNYNYNYNNNNKQYGEAKKAGYDKKVQGKYNEKTKKYKAFEKVKYLPEKNNFPHHKLASLSIDKPHTTNSIYNQDHYSMSTQQLQQQLPLLDPPAAFRSFDNNKIANEASEASVSLLDTPTSAASTKILTKTQPKTTTVTTAKTTTVINSSTAADATTQSKLAHEKDQMYKKSKSDLLNIPNTPSSSSSPPPSSLVFNATAAVQVGQKANAL